MTMHKPVIGPMTTTEVTPSHLVASTQSNAQPLTGHVAFLCHDLNNNLNLVTLRLALLRETLIRLEGLSEELAMLGLAEQAIGDTTRGMRRLLSYEQLRHTERPLLQPINLLRLVDRVAGRHQTCASVKGLQIVVDIPTDAIVLGDLDLLILALQNLIGNAVKFSDRGTIRIWSSCDEASIDSVDICISDEGRGIAPENLRRIFEAFQRGSAEGNEGVGLGLAIATQAVAALGGRLTAASTMGIGSVFSITLKRS